ncbi:MAG TPA: glycosyltransferase family 39 protein [Tepidisphaeraceae bacterium]
MLFGAWVLVGAMMFVAIVQMPVTRTQEARVLVTAREMLGKPVEAWLLPRMNGEPRLRKPPLAYWLSAGAYGAFGMTPYVGRLPAWLAAWSTLAATFLIGRRLTGTRAAALAAGALAGSWLFFKSAALAETDVLLMAAMTWGVYAIVLARAAGRAGAAGAEAAWWHAGALCMALAALTKGPQALCLLLMLVLLDALTPLARRWPARAVERDIAGDAGGDVGVAFTGAAPGRRGGHCWRFVRSGAPLTLLAVGLPWFVYAFLHADGSALADDLANSAGGGLGHAKSFVTYLPMLLMATAPWPLIWGVGLVGALRQWQAGTDGRTALILLTAWGAALLVPLLFWGNKQMHYLLPLMPAAMIAVGATLDDLTSRGSRASPLVDPGRIGRRVGQAVVVGMIGLLLVAVPGVLAYAWRNGLLVVEDFIECGAAAAVAIVLIALWRGGRLAAGTVAVAGAIMVMFLARDEWSEAARPGSPEAVATELHRRFPDAQYVFRDAASLPLLVGLGGIVPVLDDAKLTALRGRTAEGNALICLDTTTDSDQRVPPAGYERLTAFGSGRHAVAVSTVDGSRWDPDGVRDLP